MKKIIYILLISVTSNLIFTACTEENVQPVQQNNIPNVSDPA